PANTATIRSPVTCKSLAPRPPATRTDPCCSRTAPEAAGAVRDIAAIPPVSVRRWVPDTPGDTSGPVSSRLYRLPPRPCAQHHRGHTQFSGGTVPGKHVGASPCRVRGRVTHRQPTARVTATVTSGPTSRRTSRTPAWTDRTAPPGECSVEI